MFEDKNVIPYIAKVAKIKMPRTVISKTWGIIRNSYDEVISIADAEKYLENAGELFCKPAVVACGGKGCFAVNFQGGQDLKTRRTVKDVLSELGKEFVIQELIKCHPSISDIYSKSVNTFRVITYRWKDSFWHMPVFMRIGQGGAVVDNGAAGGMFIGVKNDGTFTDKACMPYFTNIESHPDTGFVFKGHKIMHFSKVLASAIKMHQMIPEVGMVYWDFTINEKGEPILIECNIRNGTVYAIQMTHGVSPFLERTPEVLQWIRKMKNTPYEKRINYAFGNI